MARLGLYPRIVEFFVIFFILPYVKGSTFSNKRRAFEPTFLNTPRNVTVHMNELARLKCHIMHLGPKQVAWRKVSLNYPLTVGVVVFDPNEDITVSYKELKEGISQWDLIIKQAKPRHSGMYECQISASVVYTHYVYLKVLDTPLKVNPGISIRGTSFVNVNEPITLTCNATGATRAPSVIDWFFNGIMIRETDPRWHSRVHISNYEPDVPSRMLVSELTINKSLFSDKGLYVCKSSSGSDRIITSMDVSVLNTGKNVERRGCSCFEAPFKIWFPHVESENQQMIVDSNDNTPENCGNCNYISTLTIVIVLYRML